MWRRRSTGRGDKAAHRESVERCREGIAELIGAHADEVAVTKNVSEALNLLASSLRWRAGDNVVFCPELEHPNNVFLWLNLRTLKGIEVRTVEPDEGKIPVDALAAAMDERTALVTIPHVSFSPGFVTDVRAISDAAHRHGSLLLVDAAQSIGALGCDVEDLGIDALGVATQKNLLGFYGLGFLYVRRALAESLIRRMSRGMEWTWARKPARPRAVAGTGCPTHRARAGSTWATTTISARSRPRLH